MGYAIFNKSSGRKKHSLEKTTLTKGRKARSSGQGYLSIIQYLEELESQIQADMIRSESTQTTEH